MSRNIHIWNFKYICIRLEDNQTQWILVSFPKGHRDLWPLRHVIRHKCLIEMMMWILAPVNTLCKSTAIVLTRNFLLISLIILSVCFFLNVYLLFVNNCINSSTELIICHSIYANNRIFYSIYLTTFII